MLHGWDGERFVLAAIKAARATILGIKVHGVSYRKMLHKIGDARLIRGSFFLNNQMKMS